MNIYQAFSVVFIAGGLIAVTALPSNAQQSSGGTPPAVTEGKSGKPGGSTGQMQSGQGQSGQGSLALWVGRDRWEAAPWALLLSGEAGDQAVQDRALVWVRAPVWALAPEEDGVWRVRIRRNRLRRERRGQPKLHRTQSQGQAGERDAPLPAWARADSEVEARKNSLQELPSWEFW